MGAQAAKVTLWICVSEAHDGNWDLDVSHPPNEDGVCAMVVSLLFASYLVSSKSGPSGPGRWGTVSLAHRPREGRLGAKSDTYISIFSTCQRKATSFCFPSLQLPLLVPVVVCIGPACLGPRVPAGVRQACPGAELPKSQAREDEGEATGEAGGSVYAGRPTWLVAPTTHAGNSGCFWSLPEGNCSHACD